MDVQSTAVRRGDRYHLPHGEEPAAALIYIPGDQQPSDAGTL
jgi:hypothetical protein